MAETFRIGKLEKFINERVRIMESTQRTIEAAKKQGLSGEVLNIIEVGQVNQFNYTSDLCREFGIEMPHVLGVSPHA